MTPCDVKESLLLPIKNQHHAIFLTLTNLPDLLAQYDDEIRTLMDKVGIISSLLLTICTIVLFCFFPISDSSVLIRHHVQAQAPVFTLLCLFEKLKGINCTCFVEHTEYATQCNSMTFVLMCF